MGGKGSKARRKVKREKNREKNKKNQKEKQMSYTAALIAFKNIVSQE